MVVPRLVCGVALLQACEAVSRFLPYHTPKSYVEPPPAFYACSGEGAEVANGCPPAASSPSRTMEDLLKSGYDSMQAIHKARGSPVAMFIGGDALKRETRWADAHLLRHVLADSGVPPSALRLAFVDPSGEQPDRFWDKVRSIGANESEVSLVSAHLDPRCGSTAKVDLFRISPEASSKFGPGDASASKVLYTNADHPTNLMRRWAVQEAMEPCEDSSGECKERQRFQKMTDFNRYVERVHMPCQQPLAMVRDLGTSVDRIGMVVVDAEGMGIQNLYPMLMHPDFAPGFVMWKASGRKEEEDLRKHLRKHRYRVGVKLLGADTTRGYGIAVLKQQPP